MKEVRYTEHLKLRLRIRRIPENYPNLILRNSDNNYFDIVENHNIATKNLFYNGKIRIMMVAYEIKGEYIEIITIHPISSEKILNRLNSGRWIIK